MWINKNNSKKKKNIKLESWLFFVQTTKNNTIVTLTDESWNKILWWGTWLVWYKGSKQSTPYAAEMLAKKILQDAKNYWLTQLWVIFKWTWLSRDGVFKAINDTGFIDIKFIKEATTIQFGGCRWVRNRRI